MTFSAGWNEMWSQVEADGGERRHPNLEKLISIYIAEAERTLELGPGAHGSNIRPIRNMLDTDYHAIEGSAAAVKMLHEQYPELAEKIVLGDFTKEIPFDVRFDLIIDRASVAHNELASIRSCLELVYGVLKPGGIFISSDWFSNWHSEWTRGTKVERGTRRDYEDGQFAGAGTVHFSDEQEMIELFQDFDRLFLQERVTRRVGPNGFTWRVPRQHWISPAFDHTDYRSAVWDLVVRRPR